MNFEKPSKTNIALVCAITSVLLSGCDSPKLTEPESVEESIQEAPRANTSPGREAENNTVESALAEGEFTTAQRTALEETDERESERKQIEEDEKRAQERFKIVKLRKEQEGRKFESFSVEGKTYAGVTINEVTDSGIRISHTAGLASIDWVQIPAEHRESWGFDAFALEEAELKRQELIANQEAYQNSPEGIAALNEASEQIEQQAKEKVEKKKSLLVAQVSSLETKIEKGKTALRSLNQAKSDLTISQNREDAEAARIKRTRENYQRDTIGGVSTSKADREKGLSKYDNRIRNAENALAQMESTLQKLRTQLRSFQ